MLKYTLILFSGLFLFALNLFILVRANKLLYKFNIIDENFEKPQAFHVEPTPRVGGLLFILNFLALTLVSNYLFGIEISFLLSLSIFFLIGFFDDIKLLENPKLRIILLISSLFFFIIFSNIKIESTGIDYLNFLIKNFYIANIIFIFLCFLTIINGTNFIDGFNGLLIIHAIIIASILLILNIDTFFFNQLIALLISLILILVINFPKAKVFLGDSGAYSIGFLISCFVIETSNLNQQIAPFFFCILLFYIFFEVLFSFARKTISKKNPLYPDKKHLHMMLFRVLNFKIFKNKLKANYMTSLILNFSYLVIILPSLIFIDDNFFCKIYFFFCLIIYLISYLILTKVQNKLYK